LQQNLFRPILNSQASVFSLISGKQAKNRKLFCFGENQQASTRKILKILNSFLFTGGSKQPFL